MLIYAVCLSWAFKAYIEHFKQILGDKMDEIEKGLEYVNSRSKTNYKNPDDVIMGAAQLAERIVAGEDGLDMYFDDHIMAIDLFRVGGVIRPLRSYNMRLASDIWLSRN